MRGPAECGLGTDWGRSLSRTWGDKYRVPGILVFLEFSGALMNEWAAYVVPVPVSAAAEPAVASADIIAFRARA
jgi:hypothetical protein